MDLLVGAIEASSHTTRRRVLALLAEEPDGLAYGEIAAKLGIRDQSAIAHHVRVLVGSALVGNILQRREAKIRSFYFLSEWGRDWLEMTGMGRQESRDIILGRRPR